MMIELFLKLIDRLAKLAELQSTRVKNAFAELYQPLFDDMFLIHQDYLNMFTEAHADLLSPELLIASRETRVQTIQAAARRLKTERVKYEPLRKKAWDLADELRSGCSNPMAEEFIDDILSYFPAHSPSDPLYTTLGSELYRVLQWTLRDEDCDVAYAQHYIHECLKQIRDHWSLITKSFAKLKRQSVLNRP